MYGGLRPPFHSFPIEKHGVYKNNIVPLTPHPSLDSFSSSLVVSSNSKVQKSLAVKSAPGAVALKRSTTKAFSDVNVVISGCNLLALSLGRFVFLPEIRAKVSLFFVCHPVVDPLPFIFFFENQYFQSFVRHTLHTPAKQPCALHCTALHRTAGEPTLFPPPRRAKVKLKNPKE